MTITVNGYSHDRNDTLSWHVDVPYGFHEPFLVKFQEFSHEKWDRLYGVEILVDYGEDALDWEFCIDDLELQFFTLSALQREASTLAKTVIKEDL